MTNSTSNPPIILIPGHWLGAWAWDEVLEHLTALGQRATALTLAGLDETDSDRITRTLDDQVLTIEQAVLASVEPVVLVAHSGANAPVSIVLDRHPDLVRRIVWIDSGPATPGIAFAPDLPEEVKELPLPPFEVLGAQVSVEGLTDAMLDRFRTRAVPEPGPVVRQIVHLTDDARFGVATTLVCCSIPSAQVIELVKAGHPMFSEVGRLKKVDYVDLPTGHWPMWSRPSDLAQILVESSSTL